MTALNFPSYLSPTCKCTTPLKSVRGPTCLECEGVIDNPPTASKKVIENPLTSNTECSDEYLQAVLDSLPVVEGS